MQKSFKLVSGISWEKEGGQGKRELSILAKPNKTDNMLRNKLNQNLNVLFNCTKFMVDEVVLKLWRYKNNIKKGKQGESKHNKINQSM